MFYGEYALLKKSGYVFTLLDKIKMLKDHIQHKYHFETYVILNTPCYSESSWHYDAYYKRIKSLLKENWAECLDEQDYTSIISIKVWDDPVLKSKGPDITPYLRNKSKEEVRTIYSDSNEEADKTYYAQLYANASSGFQSLCDGNPVGAVLI